jgi:hypothetical protein
VNGILMSDFTEVVRRLMDERRTGTRALARAVGHDPGYVSRVINGRKPAGPDIARRLDAALQAGGAVIASATAADSAPRARTGMEGPVAPELVDYFRSQLAGHYTADMYLGPRHLIPTVTTQAELITNLASAADATVRRGLLDTGTAYAALLGWLHQDAGDLTASARWRDVTLSLAHRSGDPQLISYALTNKAMLALDTGDGGAVVDYSQAALRDEHRLAPKVRVLALQHQAHGHAMTGNRAAADRLLDTAAAITGRVDDDYEWGNACRRTPHYVEVQRATCYGRTGSSRDAADAAALWDQIMDTMPEQARRDNAVFLARQAGALAVIPDPDRAVSLAADAAAAVTPTGSARLRKELRAIPARGRSWSRTAHGRQLRDIVATVA